MNRDHRSAGLPSIIIPCWDQIQFTQQCFAALKQHTRRAWELIVIDNGSTDGTAAYLAGVRDMASVPVTVVTNTTNLGFPAAINQGLRLYQGEREVFLNNDVVVTDAWLDQLIGLVNAPGNYSRARRGAQRGRQACQSDSAGTSPLPCSGVVSGSAGFTPPPCSGIVRGSARVHPPKPPPFARGGKGPLGSAGREEKGVSAAAYVVRCACDPSPDGTGGDTVVDHIRLFPLRDDVRWTFRVHEQILPALRRANVPVKWTDLTVRHTGYVDKALRARKIDRDTKILMAELEDRPNDPFVLFNLGAIAVERRDWNEALEYLKRSLAGSAPSDSIVRKLFALLARTHQMMGDSQGALAACAKGLELDPKDAELWFRKGMVHRQRGESSEAEKCWRLILTLKRPDQFCSVDQGIYGHLTRRNLAVLAQERGDRAEVRRLWEAILAECPGDREALGKLGRSTARGTRVTTARS